MVVGVGVVVVVVLWLLLLLLLWCVVVCVCLCVYVCVVVLCCCVCCCALLCVCVVLLCVCVLLCVVVCCCVLLCVVVCCCVLLCVVVCCCVLLCGGVFCMLRNKFLSTARAQPVLFLFVHPCKNMAGEELAHHVVGNDSGMYMALMVPMHLALCLQMPSMVGMDQMDGKIWHYTFHNELRVAPGEYPVLLKIADHV